MLSALLYISVIQLIIFNNFYYVDCIHNQAATFLHYN